jgi:Leucine-rich repeat (LRR) protein
MILFKIIMKKTLINWLSLAIAAFLLCLSGCKKEIQQPVPEAAGKITSEIQDDGNVLLSVETIENAETYNWYFGEDVVQSSESNTYLAKVSGTYKVTGVNKGGEGAQSDAIEVTVGLPADAGTITQETLENGYIRLSVPEIKRATSYRWYLDGNKLDDTETPTYTAEIGGSFEVAGINSVGEGKHSTAVTIAVSSFNILTEEHIPDATFREWVKTEIANGSDSYTNTEAAAYTGTINVSSMSIESMQGIEYFTGITELDCGSNKFAGLDASALINLVSLEVSNMDLQSLTLGDLPNLKTLDASRNKLKSIDVSGCPALQELNIFANDVSELNISKNTALEVLNCFANSISELDLTGMSSLTSLTCGENNLTSLNLQYCTSLTELYFQNNSISSIDLSNLKSQLVELNCSANPLVSLDLTGFSSLTWLQCQQLSTSQSLDLTGCTKLELVRCESSSLNELNVSSCSALKELYCYDNQLSKLDLSNCKSLSLLYCFSNSISALDISQCKNMGTLWCYDNDISDLKLSTDSLRDLACDRNKLESLDIAGCTSLMTFTCSENQLTSLDLSNCKSLQSLSCWGNLFQQYCARCLLPGLRGLCLSRRQPHLLLLPGFRYRSSTLLQDLYPLQL